MASSLLWQVEMPVGTIDCWVFLSCLEVLNKCEKFSGSDPIKSYSLYTASLWDYARKKVRKNTQDETLPFNDGEWWLAYLCNSFAFSVNIPFTEWFRFFVSWGMAMDIKDVNFLKNIMYVPENGCFLLLF